MTEAELRQSAILSKTEVETFSISQSFQERSPNTTESEKQILMLCKLQVFNMKKSKVFFVFFSFKTEPATIRINMTIPLNHHCRSAVLYSVL